MQVDQQQRVHYPALDGIRGLAILLVVFFHNFGFINYFGFGWLGVDLFFVLSGFLISDVLLKTVTDKNYLRNFYMRRALRIFPLYYLVLIITIFILSAIPSLNDNLNYYAANQWWFWTYLQNWLYVYKTPENTNFLLHFWSLAVEEQFYLVWPFVILLLRKPKVLLITVSFFLVFIIATRIVLWENHVEGFKYFSLYTFTRADGICIGSMLALIIRINPLFLKKYVGLVALFLSALNFLFFFLNRAHAFSFPFFPFVGYTTFAVMFALLIHEAVSGEIFIINKVFSNAILKFFGKISYGFYVFHWPIYVVLNPRLTHYFETIHDITSKGAQVLSSIIATAIGLGLSIISYHFLEMKFIKLKHRFI